MRIETSDIYLILSGSRIPQANRYRNNKHDTARFIRSPWRPERCSRRSSGKWRCSVYSTCISSWSLGRGSSWGDSSGRRPPCPRWRWPPRGWPGAPRRHWADTAAPASSDTGVSPGIGTTHKSPTDRHYCTFPLSLVYLNIDTPALISAHFDPPNSVPVVFGHSNCCLKSASKDPALKWRTFPNILVVSPSGFMVGLQDYDQ